MAVAAESSKLPTALGALVNAIQSVEKHMVVVLSVATWLMAFVGTPHSIARAHRASNTMSTRLDDG
eukprot:COSAG01_NODE_17753_length_1126_cov_6.136319_1_plen_66_part_00